MLINKKSKKTNSRRVSPVMELMDKVAKIDNLPKDVKSSIPLRGFMQNGIVETKQGNFTKTFKLDDVNFTLAPIEEQANIFENYMKFNNSFPKNVRWQTLIFNHEIDKRKTLEDIRLLPQKDGLNKYRQELNAVHLDMLKNGNNSITQDKYLTISIEDFNVDHAVKSLEEITKTVNENIKKISDKDSKILSTQERMKLLYDIYNISSDYREAAFDTDEPFDLKQLARNGLSVKDVIGPNSMDFSKNKRFMLGNTYGQALYIKKVASQLDTDFIKNLADIQANMLISVTNEGVEPDKALKLVKSQLASIDGRISEIENRNANNNMSSLLPPELEAQKESAKELLNDLTKRDQKMFLTTIVVVVFGKTLETLEESVNLVKEIGRIKSCPFESLNFQQEAGLNTALPLCRNDLVNLDFMFTTEEASLFIPYNSEELRQKDSICYGVNNVTKALIMINRLTGDNFNGIVFGLSGSGKSFAVKLEIENVLLKYPDAQIYIIDPMRDYKDLANAFDGVVVNLSPGSNTYLNPLDLDISETDEDEIDPISMKIDSIMAMFGIMIGKNRSLDPILVSIIDRCSRRIYQPYLRYLREEGISCDREKCPTLGDLYQELKSYSYERPEAGYLAEILSTYTVGSFNTFAKRTNIEADKRLIIYDTKQLGSGMKTLGLHICTQDIYNRMIQNSKKGIYTWEYIDEAHILLESDEITIALKNSWKMARKWKGAPTAIMQNTNDCLRDANTMAIINNTQFVRMFNSELQDRQNLAALYSLSDAQLKHITKAKKGTGLICTGGTVLPFSYRIPTDTMLFKINDTTNKNM